MNPLRNEQKKSHKKVKICCVFGKKFQDRYRNDKNIVKLGIIAIIQVNTEDWYIPHVI